MPPAAAPSSGSRAEPLPRLGFVLLVALTLLWGLSWPVLKTGLNALPPFTFRALMVPTGGALLLLIAKLSRQRLSMPPEIWGKIALAGFFNVTCWHAFSAFGIGHMSSGRAAVIAFTMPLWAALLAWMFLGERLTPRRIAALALGMGGIATLLGGDLAAFRADPLGPLFMAAAALTWATGTLIQKRVAWGIPVLTVTAWELVVGGLPGVAAALMFESVARAAFTPTVIAAVIFNMLGPISFCFYAWYKVVSLFPATVATLSTLMIPVIGAVSGALVLGEPLGWSEAAALALVCSAIGLVLMPKAATRPAA